MNWNTLRVATVTVALAGCIVAQEATKNDATKKETAPKPAPARTAGVATSWKQIAIPPLPPFTPKHPTRIELPNGMVLFLTENHELPLISGTALIRGGSDSEPAEKTGLVEMYGETWRTGGTEKMNGDEMDDFLEARAAKVETGGGDSNTSVSFNCLKGDFSDVFAMFADLLQHPAFRDDKLALAKQQMNAGISRRNDESGEIAGMQTEILGYGKNSAYARVPEYSTVAAVTREDLLQWHKAHTSPNNIILGIVGDFDTKEMEAAVRKAFDSWPKGEKVEDPKVPIDPAKPGIYVVDKSDVNQSEVRLISAGIERRNPDYFAVEVMNEIFGGGFSSRLFSNLRTKAGLAYSVGGGVGAGWNHPALTVLEIGTKTETTVEAIQGLEEQIDLLLKQPPTEAELKRAKDSILNSFIFNFDTPAKVLREQTTYEFYGYPSDFLEQFRTGVEKVTVDDVLRVAKKYVHKNDMRILVVGNAAEFEKTLAALGPVNKVDITIPGATQGGESKPAASNEEGKAAIAKVVKALGGPEKVASVKSTRYQLNTTLQNMPLKIEATLVLPDKGAMKIGLPQGELLMVTTPTTAFMELGGQMQDAPASQKKEQLDTFRRDLLNVAKHASDPNYSFAAQGKEKVGDVDATIVDVSGDGVNTRWWVSDDGRVLQEQYNTVGQQGPVKRTTKNSDWKNFDGLLLPTKMDQTDNNQPPQHIEVSAVEVNPQVDPKLFEKPAAK